MAIAVDRAVLGSRQDEWRSNPVKVKKIRIAIKAALENDEALTETIVELVKNQYEY